MPLTQEELDAALDRQWNLPVEVSPDAPLSDNDIYDAVRIIVNNGFPITLREFFHAIGCKAANLPVNRQDEAVKVGLKYMHLLDLAGDNLSFLPFDDSDMITSQSHEIGVAMTCIL